MPTYEYMCEKCKHRFERFQTITARPLRKCPQCGKRELKRLLGCGAGVIFKGTGFYQTDYRSESYKKAAASEKGAAGSSPAKKEPATAAKSAATEVNTAGKKAK